MKNFKEIVWIIIAVALAGIIIGCFIVKLLKKWIGRKICKNCIYVEKTSHSLYCNKFNAYRERPYNYCYGSFKSKSQ